ncbi:hypothetical protein KEM55_005831, partial [Ascosphaera atra]
EAEAALDKAKGKDKDVLADNVKTLAVDLLKMVEDNRMRVEKDKDFNDEEELQKILEERNAALDELDDDSNFAPETSSTVPAAAPEVSAPDSAAPAMPSAKTSAALVPFAPANAPETSAPGPAVPAQTEMAEDDIFQQKAAAPRSPNKCKLTATRLMTTPMTTRKRSRQEDMAPQASPIDLFRIPSMSTEVVLTAPPPASNELNIIVDIVYGIGTLLEGMSEAMTKLAESSQRTEGVLAAILAHMEDEKRHRAQSGTAQKRPRDDGGEEGEEDEEEEHKKVRREAKPMKPLKLQQTTNCRFWSNFRLF